MKIAYFINQYPKVSHTFIRREILALERRGFEVQRFALRGWSELPPDRQDEVERSKTHYVLRQGLRGLVLPLFRTMIISPRRLFAALRLAIGMSHRTDRRLAHHLLRVVEACRLALWLRDSRASRLHAHFGTNSAEVAMYARLLGGPPYSFTCHGPEEFEAPMGLAEKVRNASFVAAISSYGRSQLYLRCDVSDWPKIKMVRCGIEPAFHAGERLPIPMTPRLICVGRLCEAKGQLLLVEAAARLRAKNVEFELVLAGDGDLRATVEAAIERHGLDHCVRITGWISSERVRSEIVASRALVLPTFAEGLPVVIMEAMALRRPVLTTYVAGIPELVKGGETGWIFAAGSLDDLTSAMEECLSSSSEELQRMGDLGYARVLERHSVDTEAAALAACLLAPVSSEPRGLSTQGAELPTS